MMYTTTLYQDNNIATLKTKNYTRSEEIENRNKLVRIIFFEIIWSIESICLLFFPSIKWSLGFDGQEGWERLWAGSDQPMGYYLT
jgi:hypothetical protein